MANENIQLLLADFCGHMPVGSIRFTDKDCNSFTYRMIFENFQTSQSQSQTCHHQLYPVHDSNYAVLNKLLLCYIA